MQRPLALCGAAPPEYTKAGPASAHDPEAGLSAAAAAAPRRHRGWLRGGGGARPPRTRTVTRALKVLTLQIMFVGQLPIVFGLIAPVVLVASLRVWNLWVGIDLILGGALTAMLLGACLARRCGGRGDVFVD